MYFFSDYEPGDRWVRYGKCPYLDTFGFSWPITYSSADWEDAYGNDIDYIPTNECNPQVDNLTFKMVTEAEECGLPPYRGGSVIACWRVQDWSLHPNCACPVAARSFIYLDAVYMVSEGYSIFQKLHLVNHEHGHGMALAHHSSCGEVMSPGTCTSFVASDDADVARCIQGYAC